MCFDDHPIFRQGLAAILGNDASLELVGEAGSGEEAVSQFRECQPDVTLMDLRLPGMNGVEAIIAIRQEFPEARIVALTTETGDAQIQRALAASAKGYLLKDTSRDELFQAIRAVHRGESLVQPGVAAKLLDRFAKLSRQSAQAGRPEQLSERELEVLRLMATGAPNKEIAATLTISESTAKTHMANIFQKLDVKDRTEAVTQAIQRGIIKL